jgi:hypothetical protein
MDIPTHVDVVDGEDEGCGDKREEYWCVVEARTALSGELRAGDKCSGELA